MDYKDNARVLNVISIAFKRD